MYNYENLQNSTRKQTMTAKQALEILDNAVSQMALNRQQHATLVEALQVLVKATEIKQDEKAT